MPNLHVYPKYWQLGLAGTVAWLVVGYWGLTGQFEGKVDEVIVAFQETDENGNRRVKSTVKNIGEQDALKNVCRTIAAKNEVAVGDLNGLYYWYCINPVTEEVVSYQKVEKGAEVRGCLIYRFTDGSCKFEREVQ